MNRDFFPSWPPSPFFSLLLSSFSSISLSVSCTLISLSLSLAPSSLLLPSLRVTALPSLSCLPIISDQCCVPAHTSAQAGIRWCVNVCVRAYTSPSYLIHRGFRSSCFSSGGPSIQKMSKKKTTLEREYIILFTEWLKKQRTCAVKTRWCVIPKKSNLEALRIESMWLGGKESNMQKTSEQ